MSKGKIEKEDVSGIINMLADMKAIFHEARMDGMESHLNRGDIVRQIIMGKIPYASKEFYRKESKRRRKTPGFSMSFDDIILNIRERAEILKSQGKNAQKALEDPKAKVAWMQTHGELMLQMSKSRPHLQILPGHKTQMWDVLRPPSDDPTLR